MNRSKMNSSNLEENRKAMQTRANEAGSHALMLIDFQVDFLEDDGRMPVARNQVEPVLAAARLAMEEARRAGDPILAIGNEFRRSDRLMNFLRNGASIEGSPGAQWDARLPLKGVAYFAKWAGSAFVNPRVKQWLEKNHVSSLTLSGLKANACVTATAKDALKLGYKVRVLEDAVACGSDSSREAALRRLARRGVIVGRSDSYSSRFSGVAAD